MNRWLIIVVFLLLPEVVFTQTVSTPSFSVVGGNNFTAAPKVNISSDPGASICYTIDGTTPTASVAGTCDTTDSLGNPIYYLPNNGPVYITESSQNQNTSTGFADTWKQTTTYPTRYGVQYRSVHYIAAKPSGPCTDNNYNSNKNPKCTGVGYKTPPNASYWTPVPNRQITATLTAIATTSGETNSGPQSATYSVSIPASCGVPVIPSITVKSFVIDGNGVITFTNSGNNHFNGGEIGTVGSVTPISLHQYIQYHQYKVLPAGTNIGGTIYSLTTASFSAIEPGGYANIGNPYPTPYTIATGAFLLIQTTPAAGNTTGLTATITSASDNSSAVATFSTSADHGFLVGQPVLVTGVTPNGYNGTWTVASIPDTKTFTADIGTPSLGAGTTGVATLTRGANLTINWTTAANSDSLVFYGFGFARNSYSSAGANAGPQDTGGVGGPPYNHSVTIPNLLPGSAYTLQIVSRGVSGTGTNGSPCGPGYVTVTNSGGTTARAPTTPATPIVYEFYGTWPVAFGYRSASAFCPSGCGRAGQGFGNDIVSANGVSPNDPAHQATQLNSPGGSYVTQGQGIYFKLNPYIISGAPVNGDFKYVVTVKPVTGGSWPTGMTIAWPSAINGGWFGASGSGTTSKSPAGVPNDTYTVNFSGSNNTHEMYLGTCLSGSSAILGCTGTTPPGDFLITITGQSVSGSASSFPTKTFYLPLTVVSSSTPFSSAAFPYGTAPTSPPPIPGLATFMYDAYYFGSQNCAQDLQGPGYGNNNGVYSNVDYQSNKQRSTVLSNSVPVGIRPNIPTTQISVASLTNTGTSCGTNCTVIRGTLSQDFTHYPYFTNNVGPESRTAANVHYGGEGVTNGGTYYVCSVAAGSSCAAGTTLSSAPWVNMGSAANYPSCSLVNGTCSPTNAAFPGVWQVAIAGASDSTFNNGGASITITGSNTFSYNQTGAGSETINNAGITITPILTPVSASFSYGAWFYDGMEAFTNIENLLNYRNYSGYNSSYANLPWQVCRNNQASLYRDGYALPQLKSIHAIMTFSKGYTADYLSNGSANPTFAFPTTATAPTYTGSLADKTMINNFGSGYGWPYLSGGQILDTSYSVQRETAYFFRNEMFGNYLGFTIPSYLSTNYGPPNNYMASGYCVVTPCTNGGAVHQMNFWRDYAQDHLLSQLDQFCLTGNIPQSQPYFVAIQLMELIDYYTLQTNAGVPSTDPSINRIPPAVACSAAELYKHWWQAVDAYAFPYDFTQLNNGHSAEDGGSNMTNLVGLISPVYAWLYMMTGNDTIPGTSVTYQQAGDPMFYSSVNLFSPPTGNFPYNNPAFFIGWPSTANGSGGKTFTQNYSWEPYYVEWRSAPKVSTPSFSVPGGTYTQAQKVTVAPASVADAGAIIYYCIYTTANATNSDGGTGPCHPSTSSVHHSAAPLSLVVSSSQTIAAIATSSTKQPSFTATATYQLSGAAVTTGRPAP